MQSGFIADKSLGYVQAAAGFFDTAKLVSTLTFSNQSGPGLPPGTSLLLILPEAQAIRMRADGVAPTVSVGYPLAVGAEFRYAGSLSLLQIISAVAGAAVNIWAMGT